MTSDNAALRIKAVAVFLLTAGAMTVLVGAIGAIWDGEDGPGSQITAWDKLVPSGIVVFVAASAAFACAAAQGQRKDGAE